MRTAASRLHKGFSYERRLSVCESAFEREGACWAGSWRFWMPASAHADSGAHAGTGAARVGGDRAFRKEPYSAVVLDLGCGKGEYTVACAKVRPDVLFVGIDVDPVCVLRSAEEAVREGAGNAVFIHDENPDLATYFDAGELSAILVNFPTPFPKKKKAPLRLTYADRLMAYRALLAPGAPVRLRTDSQPFFDFSLTQLEIAGYELQWSTSKVREMFPDEPQSAYERKLTAQGAPVLGFQAVPGAVPASIEQTAPLSLVSYLPDDLDSLDYVPHGMQGTVANMRARNANRRAKGQDAWQRPIV